MARVDKGIRKEVIKEVIEDFRKDPCGLMREFEERVGEEVCNQILEGSPIAVFLAYVALLRNFEKEGEEQKWKEALTNMDLSKMLWL